MQDVARDEHVLAFAGELAEKVDRLRAHHRVEAVQRLVQHHDLGPVGDRLGQLDPLPHALAVAGDPPVGRVDQSDPLQRPRGQPFRLAPLQPVQQQVGEDELPAADAAREGVVLGAVAEVPELLPRAADRDAQDADLAPRGPQQPRQQVHQGALARTVRPHQAGDPRLDDQVDPVDAQHVPVELRDLAEDDAGGVAAHLTTSNARTRR